MPSPETIVESLRSIANSAIGMALAWHVILLAACIALAVGWRPSQRSVGLLLATPVASVSAVAFRYGNPFNGIVFAVLALTMLGVAVRLEPRPVHRGGSAATAIGLVMIAFSWVYPHFLESRLLVIYIVAAPTGLIPCPTLSLVIGFTSLAGGLGSRAWCLVLGTAGLFYGAFGVARLGVQLDIALAAGALCLLALAVSARGTTHVSSSGRRIVSP